MAFLERILLQRRLVFTVVTVFALSGAFAWKTMIRQEDPRLPEYWGQVVVSFPGAESELVERLVLEPIEDQLAEVTGINWTDSTAFSEMAVLFIELQQDVDDADTVWDDVREALDEAHRAFPIGAGKPQLNDEAGGDLESVVLALTGSPDQLKLLAAARVLETEFLDLPQVAKTTLIADPGEQITVELDDVAAQRYGVTHASIGRTLQARNRILPGGSLHLGERTARLRPLSEYSSVEEISMTPIALASGGSIPLSEISRVHLGPREPMTSRMRIDGQLAIGIGIIAKKDTNIVSFGHAVRDRVSSVAPTLAPIEIHEVAFQPHRVALRLDQLGDSLLLGILIVAGVVIVAMGLRLGLIVASVVPLVAMAALAVFAAFGGVLHQISIAALVLALGMLVDNAIVVAENVQWRLDRGATRFEAAISSVRELALPLAASTATTIAAFVPMLLAQGPTAEFTRSIPIIIMLTLVISYLFAIFVTPMLSQMFLTSGSSSTATLTDRLGRRLAHLATRRPVWVIGGAGLLITLSLLVSSQVQQQFFPSSDRNQLVVDIRLPEGSHLEATDHAARSVEQALLGLDEVQHVATFTGRSAPKFYYNLPRVPWSPHFAQIVVQTRTTDDVEAVVDWVRHFARRELPGLEVVPKKLEQGPPVEAPIEIRLLGENLDDLHQSAQSVVEQLRAIPGAIDVRHDLGPGEPTLVVAVDDAAAARYGIMREQVAWALYGNSRGLPVGELYSLDDPIPIVVRSSAGERLRAEELDSIKVASAGGGLVPLAQIARIEGDWRPAAINHRDRRRIVTVSSQLAPGTTYSDVLNILKPQLSSLETPAGIEIAFGGDAEGSVEANTAMVQTLPIGGLLLLGVLLAEFNSFRKVAIILATVPLAAAGVVPGLLLFRQPFGFMSFLGVIALVGIVVNNAIVLLEVVERRRRQGAPLEEALSDGVRQRIRPILLTTATTVLGLLPLAFSPSTLWPPLASAMISGLLASTLLTLIVVPALYRLLIGGVRAPLARVAPAAAHVAVGMAVLLLSTGSGEAQEPRRLTLSDTMRLAAQRPAAKAQRLGATAVDQAGLAERRFSYLPTLGLQASTTSRNRDLELVTPLGSFPISATREDSAGAELMQPIFHPAQHLWGNAASRLEAEAASLAATRAIDTLAATAAEAHLAVLELEARRSATQSFLASLRERLDEVEAMVAEGRSLEADGLKIRLAVEQAEQDLLALDEFREVAQVRLAQTVGVTELVIAQKAPDWTSRPVPRERDLIQLALAARDDLAAIQTVTESLENRRQAIRAQALPELDARLTWSWSNGAPYTTDNWAEGAVFLTWNVFAAGTRAPQAAAIAAKQHAKLAELEELRRGIELEIRSAFATLITAQGAVAVGDRGYGQASETLRVERERHAAGRSTTYELLLATAQLRDKATQRELARLAVVRAWIGLWLATGSSEDPAVLWVG
ncbi:MAG: TolC family protein [bacterium]|nr:TolC family protein [bacterium]